MRKYNLGTYIYCILVAFVFLLICSRSSFLYPCNDWNDANCFFTMGKGMMNGQVLYRDLFEQKGPYLFLVYGIAWLFSNDTFWGVFLLEIVALSVFLYYSYKLICLYCRAEIAKILLPVIAGAMTVSWSFYWGGSAEEFCLPLMAIGLYGIVKYYKEDNHNKLDNKIVFLNGILAGIVLQIKYNLLGFWFAWMFFYVLTLLFKRKWLEIIKSSGLYLAGMILPSIPWLIYFGVHGALGDYYECYIYNNVFLYANMSEGPGIGEKIYLLAKILYFLILDNTSYFGYIIIGLMAMVFSWKTKWCEKINICMLFGFTFLGIYIGDANLPYYSIPLMTFSVIGAAYVGQWIEFIWVKMKFDASRIYWVVCGLAIIIGACVVYNYSGNTYFMKYEKDDFFLYRFKEVIEEEDNPTLLNYGCLDVGLYTVADIMPSCRFYHACNMVYPEMTNEQIRYIEEGLVQFVVSENNYPDSIYNNYELISTEVYMHFGTPVEYYLFKLKSS